MRYSDHFDAFDTSVGKYSAYKVPKWNGQFTDLMDYFHAIDDISADNRSTLSDT